MSDTSQDGFPARMRRFFARMVLGEDYGVVENPLQTPAEQDASGEENVPNSPSYVEQVRKRMPMMTHPDPKTLAAETSDPSLNRPVVFEPALKQFAGAYRGGEPQFDNPAVAESWHLSRMQALRHIVRTIAESTFAESLVIRGSVLLPTWLGECARRPGDLDCVVLPDDWKLNDKPSKELIDGLVQRLQGSTDGDAIEIPDQLFASEEIWTYERAPGLRVIVPWQVMQTERRGTIQIDFVFGETLPSPPIELEVRIGAGMPISIQAASAAQSLAWKLLWLTTDSYASGKDLYDAVLLAEYAPLEFALLEKTFQLASDPFDRGLRDFTKTEMRNWYVEWEDFQTEYPQIEGTEEEWKERLVRALGPLWKEMGCDAE